MLTTGLELLEGSPSCELQLSDEWNIILVSLEVVNSNLQVNGHVLPSISTLLEVHVHDLQNLNLHTVHVQHCTKVS